MQLNELRISKMPKATTPTERSGRRHNPLDADIVGGSGILRSGAPGKKSKSKAEKEEEHYVNSKQSARILQLGRELADEDDKSKSALAEPQRSAFDVDSRFAPGEEEQDGDVYEDDEAWGDEEEEIELDEAEIAPEDLAMFNKFLSTDDEDPLLKHGWDRKPGAGEEQQQGGTNLADLIMEKIEAFESGVGEQQDMGGMDDYLDEDLPPKVIEVYAKYVAHDICLSLDSTVPCGFMLTRLQVWHDPEQMEEWPPTETHQDLADSARLGENHPSCAT